MINNMSEQAQQIVAQCGFKPAGKEWFEALYKAQQLARPIPRSKGIPNNRGEIKFFIAAAEDFTNESRRCLLHEDVQMGWFRQATQITEVGVPGANSIGGPTLKITACFVVFHHPSNQAQAFMVEWTTKNDGDAMAASHTRLTRRFVQGLLQIPVVDESEANPEDPPEAPGCSHRPQELHRLIDNNLVMCGKCNEVIGSIPQGQPIPAHLQSQVKQPPQQQAPQQPQRPHTAQPQQPQQHPGTHQPPPPQRPPQSQAPAPVNGRAPAPQQQAPAPAPQQQQAPAPQQQQQAPAPAPQNNAPSQAPAHSPAPSPRPGNGAPIPVGQEPIVQQTQQILEATRISQQQYKQETAARQTAPGEPTSPEGWREVLVKQGLDVERATQLAHLVLGEPVDLFLMEDLRNWAWAHYNGDGEKIVGRWRELNFQPAPQLPADQRPRPTGLQVLRFLSKINFPSTAKA